MRLSQDFAELAAAGTSFVKLGAAAAPHADEMDEALRRAAIALNEREDLLGDTRALITNPRDAKPVDAAIAKAAAARAKADAKTTANDRARALKSAEALLTRALLLAEKYAKRAQQPLPPPRVRSGDVVGPASARVVVPRGTGTAIDGSWILFPSGAVQGRTITLTAVPDVVGGRDTPAGTAVAIGPLGLALSGTATVNLRATLPDGASAGDLAMFLDDGGGPEALAGRTLNADGTMSADTTVLGTFQPGVAAPPLGAPDGRYVVFLFGTILNPGSAANDIDPLAAAGHAAFEFNFRRQQTGTASTAGLRAVTRSFDQTSPHHVDDAQTSTLSGFDFQWASPEPGRFTLSAPEAVIDSAVGAASADGSVIVLAGRGETFEVFGIGVRSPTGTTTADLAGRWIGAELGVRLLDGGQAPFRTEWRSGFRTIDVTAGGVVTFDTGGTLATTTTEYRTNLADPVHTLALASQPDGGTYTVSVGPTGFVSDGPPQSQKVFGVLAKAEGILVLATNDVGTGPGAVRRTSFTVAVRQPASLPAETFRGTWSLARFAREAAVGTPDARSSTNEFVPRHGTLAVDAAGDATLSLFATTRTTHTLTGTPPTSSLTWTGTRASAAEAAFQDAFPLVLDAAATHRPTGAPDWYAVSEDGQVLVGTSGTDGADGVSGITIGVK